MITKPQPFDEAIGFLLGKEQLPAEWDAAMWQQQEPDFRTKAFWSANVENARFLDRAHTLLFDYMAEVREAVVKPDGTTETALSVSDRSHFVKRMRDFMIAEGMAKKEEFQRVNQKDVTDIRSLARLNLIFDTTVRQSYGFGQWKQGMTPAALKAFPAARLIRERGVKEPRPRHQAHLGEVRLKTDPWWATYINARIIGGFEVPWGPYGFGSGVNQEDVSRREAAELGLSFDTAGSSMNDKSKITDGTEASTKKMDPALKQRLLDELRGKVAPHDPKEAARRAAQEVRRKTVTEGLAEAVARGDAASELKFRKAIAELPNATQGFSVFDEGSRLILREGIGERLSKLRKQSRPHSSQGEKIAKAIFRSVDRKTAEPQTRPNSGKGASRGRQLIGDKMVLTPEERRILKSPYEILLVHDADGRLRCARMGTKSDVGIPTGTAKDAILSHNHPSGRGPSDSDLKSALSNPGRTLRIVTKIDSQRVEIFSLKAVQQASKQEITDITTEYRALTEELGDTAEGRREALSLILADYSNILTAERAIVL